MASAEEGYDDERFESHVPRKLRCAICLNVLKQPMQCVKNEHSFCRPCILRYLQQTQRCPMCIEPLTPQTLRPSRLAADLLSDLKIRCDNAARGCAEFVKLETLEGHVAGRCEFSPVQCSNEGCEMVVNRKDKQHHEDNECYFREGKCEVCGEDVAYGKRMLHCYVTKTEMNEVKEEISDIKEIVLNMSREVIGHMGQMKDEMDEMKDRVGELKDRVGKMNDEMNNQMGEMKDQLSEMKDQIKDQMGDVTQQVPGMKSEVDKIKKVPVQSMKHEPQSSACFICPPAACLGPNVNIGNDVSIAGEASEMKDEMGEMKLEVATIKECHRPKQDPESDVHSLGASSACFQPSTNIREDIIVAGGEMFTSSVEMFSWTTSQWTLRSSMVCLRESPSSFVHEGQMFVCGGFRWDCKDTIEVLNLNKEDAEWNKIPATLPYMHHGHTSTVYENNLFIFGGRNAFEGGITAIYKICLVAFSFELVFDLPNPIAYHGSQRFGDKVIIVGGTTTGDFSGSLDSVLSYDITRNCCQTLAPLPFAVCRMATVALEDNIIIIGGRDKDGEKLDTIVAYNIKNEKSIMLPQMKHKRSECSAVLTGFVMVVMGGLRCDDEEKNSVECFNFLSYSWEELPPTIEKRTCATAVVKHLL